jgi:diadenosine tetraphosphate (Ap4A) HIT family hydrolase
MCSRWQDEPDLQVAELQHCYVQLNRDQFFPGYTFVFAKAHVTELFHLEATVRHELIDEVNTVAEALFTLYQPTKINYELLGNMVPHMHWHLVPRFSDDPLWPRPIWSEPHDEVHLDAPTLTKTVAALRQTLGV